MFIKSRNVAKSSIRRKAVKGDCIKTVLKELKGSDVFIYFRLF